MKCPSCDAELRIVGVRNMVENDDTPDVPTKLFLEQDLECVNVKCPSYQQIVETIKTEIPIG